MMRNSRYANGRDYVDRRNWATRKIEVELSAHEIHKLVSLLRDASTNKPIEISLGYLDLAKKLESAEHEESERYLDSLIEADAEVNEMLKWMDIRK